MPLVIDLFLSIFSLLVVETADRPGLLVDLVKIIADINITVQSGEFDTEVIFVCTNFVLIIHVARELKVSLPVGLVGQGKVPCLL